MPVTPEYGIHTPDGTTKVKNLPADLERMATDVDDALVKQRQETAADRQRAEAAATRAEAIPASTDGIMAEKANDPESKFSKALAGNLAIPTMVATEVAERVSELELVEGKGFLDEEWAIPFTDADDYAAGGITQSGAAKFADLRHADKSIPFSAFGNTVPVRPVTDPEYAIPFIDEDGYIAGGWLTDGSFHSVRGGSGGLVDPVALANQVVGLTRSRKDRHVILGDSLSRGFLGGQDWAYADAWPGQMLPLLPAGTQVFNLSESGRSIDELRVKVGSIVPQLQVAGGVIPESGPVDVTFQTGIGFMSSTTRTFTGWVQAADGSRVAGTLSVSHQGRVRTAATFTRTTAGATAAVAAIVPFRSDFEIHKGDTMHAFLGRNDVSDGIVGIEGSVEGHVIASTNALIEWMTPQVKHFVLYGTTTSTTEYVGAATAGYGRVTAIESALASQHPNLFCPLRHYLVTQAIHDMGIEPTATDLARMAADTLPPSIMGDTIHYTKATAKVIGPFVARWLLSKGLA